MQILVHFINLLITGKFPLQTCKNPPCGANCRRADLNQKSGTSPVSGYVNYAGRNVISPFSSIANVTKSDT